MGVDKPQKLIHACGKFRFNGVGIKVNVRVHALDIHLVGVAVHSFVFGIIASGVFNDSILEHLEQHLIVFGVHIDFQRVHAAVRALIGAYLDSTIGGKVFTKTAQVLTIIVFDDQDGGVDVLLHLVGKVAEDVVVSILEALGLGQKRDFMVRALKAHKRDAFPVIAFNLARFGVSHRCIWSGVGTCIRL